MRKLTCKQLSGAIFLSFSQKQTGGKLASNPKCSQQQEVYVTAESLSAALEKPYGHSGGVD
jgi:hypothetical protein